MPRVVRLIVTLPEGAATAQSWAQFAVSPDGGQIAMNLRSSRGTQIWIRSLDAFEMRPLAGTEGAISAPIWSPDGREIAFSASGVLKRIAVAGGPAQVVCQCRVTFGDWMGEMMLASGGASAIQRIPAQGGEAKPVTQLAAGDLGHFGPTFLPDGRRFLFTVSGSTARTGVYVGSVDGGDSTLLLAGAGNGQVAGGYILYSRGEALIAQPFDAASLTLSGEPMTLAEQVRPIQLSRRLAFSTSSAGASLAFQAGRNEARLTWLDRTGRDVGGLGDPMGLSTLALSRDGSRVAFGRADPRSNAVNVWVTDIARNVSTRLTSGSFRESDPAWSPNDDRLVFNSNEEGGKHLYTISAAGGTMTQILKGPNLAIDDWSPDGRYVLYHGEVPVKMFALELSGERCTLQVSHPEAVQPDEGAFSPDGRAVAFNSDETGRSEIFLKVFPPTGEKWQLSDGGGVQPRWRRDGRELYYLAPDGTMMAVAIASPPPALKASAPVPLFKTRLLPSPQIEQYAVTADGQRFLVMDPIVDERLLPLGVILNWPALLEGR